MLKVSVTDSYFNRCKNHFLQIQILRLLDLCFLSVEHVVTVTVTYPSNTFLWPINQHEVP